MYSRNVALWVKVKKELYKYFRKRYPELPLH